MPLNLCTGLTLCVPPWRAEPLPPPPRSPEPGHQAAVSW